MRMLSDLSHTQIFMPMPESLASCLEYGKLSLPLSAELQAGYSASCKKYGKNNKPFLCILLKNLFIVAWSLS